MTDYCPPLPPPAPDPLRTDRHYRPFDPARDPARTIDRLLKRPAQLAYELCEGQRRLVFPVLAIALLSAAGYGLLMGSFSGGAQLWRVPLKAAGGLFASAAICLPSLYIFSCLGGTRLTLSATAALLAEGLALAGILLCGLVPVVWIFSQSTQSVGFMGLLHVVAWLGCCWAGLSLLGRSLRRHQEGGGVLFAIWSVIFLLVLLQMTAFLRPLVAPADAAVTPGKVFFLTHWDRALGGR